MNSFNVFVVTYFCSLHGASLVLDGTGHPYHRDHAAFGHLSSVFLFLHRSDPHRGSATVCRENLGGVPGVLRVARHLRALRRREFGLYETPADSRNSWMRPSSSFHDALVLRGHHVSETGESGGDADPYASGCAFQPFFYLCVALPPPLSSFLRLGKPSLGRRRRDSVSATAVLSLSLIHI